MSRDVQVWLARPVELDVLLADERWSDPDRSGLRELEGPDWRLLIGGVDRVEPEDVPPEVAAVIPSVTHLVGLTLEGSGRGRGGRLLRELERRLAEAGAGLIDDPNDADLVDAEGNRHPPAAPGPRPRPVDVVRLSWFWAPDSPIAGRSSLRELLARIEFADA